PVHRNHCDRQAEEDGHDVNEGPEEIPGLARCDIAVEVGLDVIDHQRSTSPRTMSRVPITAMTSATNAPRTIMSSACKFTNEGGRPGTRYGWVEPSLTMKYPNSPLGASIEW